MSNAKQRYGARSGGQKDKKDKRDKLELATVALRPVQMNRSCDHCNNA